MGKYFDSYSIVNSLKIKHIHPICSVMRYNDKELVKLSSYKSEREGVLYHLKPQGTDWSDIYQQQSFKERYFKLIANLLFYYKINEGEYGNPTGILVLENAQIAYERPRKGIPFAFSINFINQYRGNDAKHIFSCRCESDVNEWIEVLKTASYEYWRSQFLILKTKIEMKTGKNSMLEQLKSNVSQTKITDDRNVKVKQKKSTFYSHINTEISFESFATETSVSTCKTSREAITDNLISI